jgi:hypothetical protein
MCDVKKKKNKIESNYTFGNIHFNAKKKERSYNFDVSCLSWVFIASYNEENRRAASTDVPHDRDIPLPP